MFWYFLVNVSIWQFLNSKMDTLPNPANHMSWYLIRSGDTVAHTTLMPCDTSPEAPQQVCAGGSVLPVVGLNRRASFIVSVRMGRRNHGRCAQPPRAALSASSDNTFRYRVPLDIGIDAISNCEEVSIHTVIVLLYTGKSHKGNARVWGRTF